jgi:hypothetical protein
MGAFCKAQLNRWYAGDVAIPPSQLWAILVEWETSGRPS